MSLKKRLAAVLVVAIAAGLTFGIAKSGREITEKQEEIVSSIGASYIQGFRFARPVPGETAKEYFLGKRNDALLNTI